MTFENKALEAGFTAEQTEQIEKLLIDYLGEKTRYIRAVEAMLENLPLYKVIEILEAVAHRTANSRSERG
jgi:hypothetical protein